MTFWSLPDLENANVGKYKNVTKQICLRLGMSVFLWVNVVSYKM